MRTLTRLRTMLLLAVALLLAAHLPALAARVAVYDRPSEDVIKDHGDCLEVIDGEDGIASGSYHRPGAPYYNIWLGSPTGCVATSSDSLVSVVCIQYHSSDSNDGVSDIYIDDMLTPLVRIDTYLRGSWYVEISDLSLAQHDVKVCASGNTNMAGVIPSPHRTTPALGDNDIWDFCFGNITTPIPAGTPDPSHSYADWANLAPNGTTVFACPGEDGSVLGVLVRDRDSSPITNALVTVEFAAGCGSCRCQTVTAVTDSMGGLAILWASMGLDRSIVASCCVVTATVRCLDVLIPWSGTGGSLVDSRAWISPDLDGDCGVGAMDYMMFTLDMGTSSCRSDFDCSGLVDTTDFNIFSAHFPHSCSPAGVADEPSDATLAPSLEQNYPNPFSPETRIAFHVAVPGRVTLRVHNAAGQLVRVMTKECGAPGKHEVTWNGRGDNGVKVATGVYFVRLETPQGSVARRMLLLR